MAPTTSTDRMSPLAVSIVELLRFAGGGPLSQEAITFVLSQGRLDVTGTVSLLIDQGRLAEKLEHGESGLVLLDLESTGETGDFHETWSERLVEYALSSPGATVHELVVASEQLGTEPALRAMLLHQAVKAAREIGEFRMVGSLIEDLIGLSGDGLSEVQVRDIISMIEPRKLRDMDRSLISTFIKAAMEWMESPSDRIMALARLGEMEIIGNHLPKGILLLNEALSISVEHETGEWIPVIIENLAEMTSDYDRMNRTADQIQEVIAWTPVLVDDDLKLRILATAAASLARIKRHKAADTTIQSAIALSPQVSPDARRVLEWCRARVHIASGRVNEAVIYLERALLLAENLNDQVAVSDILDTLVSTMKGQPGYTVRSLTAIMERVSRRATTSGNVSNQIYALNHLADMYLRTLQFSGVARVYRDMHRLVDSAGISMSVPVAEWCNGFMCHLAGEAVPSTGADVLIPGSSAFLLRMEKGEDPVTEAQLVAEHFNTCDSNNTLVYGLFLALDAFGCGFRSSASVVAAALQRYLGSMEGENVPSWKLCVSGILAEEDGDAEDFLSSAEVLARQMDRLLLVWLLLRCRLTLDIPRDQRKATGLSLLLLELDQYVAFQFSEDMRARFSDLPRVRELSEEMERISGRSGPVSMIRDALSRTLEGDPIQVLDEVGKVSSRFSSRSEISWSLEAMGAITRSSRIQALRVSSGELRIIESYGLGRERLPGRESAEIVLRRPDTVTVVDNFGVSPFGSRRFVVIPTSVGTAGEGVEKRLPTGLPDTGSYLLLEMETPFEPEVNTDFMISCFVRQIGSALLLRERETQSYFDAMTGAAIRSSWMKKLNEELAAGATPSSPLSVLLVDIDRFKIVNDTFGHREGDRVLKAVVSSISRALRPSDTIGRIGGDEFGIILPSASPENAMMIAERICRKVSSSVFRRDQLPMTVSIGVASVDTPDSQSDLVISRADAALYQSKQSGRNRPTAWSSESDVVFNGRKPRSLLDTGDPGWDHILGQTVIELLSSPADEPSVQLLAERLRDVLRCEYFYLESGSGEKSGAGPEFAARAMEMVHHGYPGRISEHNDVLGKFYVLSRVLPHGGYQLAVWDEADILPGSMKGVFEALGNLSDLLMDGR